MEVYIAGGKICCGPVLPNKNIEEPTNLILGGTSVSNHAVYAFHGLKGKSKRMKFLFCKRNPRKPEKQAKGRH